MELEEKIKQAGETATDGEAGGIVSSIIYIDEHSHGTRAGKDEDLKSSKVERKIIRWHDAISALHDKISRENSNYARIVEKGGNLRLSRSRIHSENGENENASGLVDAMEKIAAKLGSDADLED